MSDWNFAAVWDGIATIVPDRDALVCGDRRITWAGFAGRATRLAWYLRSEAGVRPGDRVAIDLTNRTEYLETFYAALKLGAVPVNVNFRYQAHELRYLLDNSDARALVHAAEFSTTVQEATGLLTTAARPLLLEAGEPYERALATSTPPVQWTPRTPAGDDLIFLYTGGTTGAPKGVMWRNDDLYVALWASSHPGSPEPPDPWAAARGGQAGIDVAPRGTADARDRPLRRRRRARRERHRRAGGPPRSRSRTGLGRRRA